jgi:hypothetical protein
VFDEDSALQFFHAGFYGLGDGGSAAGAVAAGLRRLLTDPAGRERLGAYGRSVVLERFSLRAAADRLLDLYGETIAAAPSRLTDWREAAVIGGRAAGNELRLHLPAGKRQRKADRAARLDAAATGPARP